METLVIAILVLLLVFVTEKIEESLGNKSEENNKMEEIKNEKQ